MYLFLVLAFATAACGFSGASGMETGEPDAMPDAGKPDPGSGCVPGFLDVCNEAAPVEELVVGADTEIDTGADPRCRVRTQTGGPDICLLAFTRIDIQQGNTLLAHGSRALALVSTGNITIAGTLDVSSRRTRLTKPGAGGSSTCTFATAPGAANGGGAGGAGGTLIIQGGGGGNGNTDNQGGGNMVAGGTPGVAVVSPTILLGGCQGQPGANADGGAGGLAGGAVYLTGPSIQISGAVLAGGSGGTPGSPNAGGGGGGSGGSIVVQSPSISHTGLLLATGGGGGSGGGGVDPGNPGLDPTSATMAAAGGNAPGSGGDGGIGVLTTPVAAMRGQNAGSGGGGGGGGGGFILVLSPSAPTGNARMAPTAVTRTR